MKLILLFLFPLCVIGQGIRLQFPVLTFQPVKFTIPGITIGQTASVSSRNGNSPITPSARTSSGISSITPVTSSNNGAELQTSVLMSRVRNSMNASPSANNFQQTTAPRNVEQRTSTMFRSTNPDNNSPNVLSTRSSINDPQPQESVTATSVVRQNSLPVSSTSSSSASDSQPLNPGNVARQIKLLMSKNRNGGVSGGVSARTSSRSSPSGPSCSTPDGENGVCAHVSDCNLFLPYMDLMDQPAVQIFFIERVCRITNMEMHVCCPLSPFAQGPVLRAPTTVVPTENECGFPLTNRLVNGEQVSNFFGAGC